MSDNNGSQINTRSNEQATTNKTTAKTPDPATTSDKKKPKKIFRTVEVKIGFVDAYTYIDENNHGKNNAQKRRELKEEYGKKIEGDNFEYTSIFNDMVADWRKKRDQLQADMEAGNNKQKRAKSRRLAYIQEVPKFTSDMTKERFGKLNKFLHCKAVQDKIEEVGVDINGAKQITDEHISEIFDLKEDMDEFKDSPNYNDLCNYVKYRVENHDQMNGLKIQLDSVVLVANIPSYDKEHKDMSPWHSDIENSQHQKGFHFQGSLILTPSHMTICHPMENVPWTPTPKQATTHLMKETTTILTRDTLEKALDKGKIRELLDQYGRLLYTSKACTPIKIDCESGHITIMNGNHPHRSPGTDKYRIVVFFTGRTTDSDQAKYNNTQMTKEKLLLKIARRIISCQRKENREQHIGLVTYIFECMANAVRDSLAYGSFDGTLDKDGSTDNDFHDQKFVSNYQGFIKACTKFYEEKTDEREANMNARKQMFITRYADMIIHGDFQRVEKEGTETTKKKRKSPRNRKG